MLPFGWTAERLLGAHASKPYNPDIARVFYRAGYIESWGRGIQKIIDACKNLGADEPEYIVSGGDIMVKFTALQSAKVPDSKTPNRHFGGLDGGLESAMHLQVIEKIKSNPHIAQKDLASETHIPLRTIQRIMKELQENGKIERKGGKRYGYWEVHEE